MTAMQQTPPPAPRTPDAPSWGLYIYGTHAFFTYDGRLIAEATVAMPTQDARIARVFHRLSLTPRSKEYPLMTDHTTATTRPPAMTECPWESGIRRGRDTIEVAIPDGRDTSTSGNPIHVEADVLYKAIDLLQVLVFSIDPLKDDGADLGMQYRLRIATRQIATRLEEAVLADVDTDYGEPCRAFIAELPGHDEMDAGAGRSAP